MNGRYSEIIQAPENASISPRHLNLIRPNNSMQNYYLCFKELYNDRSAKTHQNQIQKAIQLQPLPYPPLKNNTIHCSTVSSNVPSTTYKEYIPIPVAIAIIATARKPSDLKRSYRSRVQSQTSRKKTNKRSSLLVLILILIFTPYLSTVNILI